MRFTSSSACCFSRFVGRSPKPAIDCESRVQMDYIVGGVTALFLFGYLIYALLRPERF
jgi:K+-transporting ATPase KdpF subunit